MGEERTLVVVGAGTAGIPCAVAAAEAGAHVIVVEKDSRIGGSLWVSGAHFSGAGTRRQSERGIEDNPGLHFADGMRISNGTARADLLWRAVQEAPGMVDWLESIGFDFDPNCPRVIYGHEPYSVARTYYGVDGGRSLLDVLEPLWSRQVEAGHIELHASTRVTQIVVEDGRAVGIRARGPEGSEYELRGDAVVLATGGYGYAKELIREFHPGVSVMAGAHHTATGDALRIAGQIGAGVVGSDKFLPTFGGLEDPDKPGRILDFMENALLFMPQYRLPWEIYVDVHGRRFVAEDNPSVDLRERRLMMLPDQRFWLVFDERGLEDMKPLAAGWTADTVRRLAEESAVPVFRRDTLAELAARCGIDAPGLGATVDAYNTAVETGRDRLGRVHLPAPIAQPPFYAVSLCGCVILGFTGVDVDQWLRVRRTDGTIMPGLFAVGEALGAGVLCGNSFLSGMSVGPCISFGRALGRTAPFGELPWAGDEVLGGVVASPLG